MSDVDVVAELEALRADVAELKRTRGLGDADRILLLAEVADLVRYSPATIEWWLGRRERRESLRLVGCQEGDEHLFVRGVSGRLESTPRRVASWKRWLNLAMRNGRVRLLPPRRPDGHSSESATSSANGPARRVVRRASSRGAA